VAKNILIIDDEELITRTLLKLLKKEGYTPIVAKSGEEALEKIKISDFDLIITDVRMPGLDGIETIRQIRGYLQQNNKKPVPEIVITGFANEESYKQAVQLKVKDYIFKPFDLKQFIDIIKKNLNG